MRTNLAQLGSDGRHPELEGREVGNVRADLRPTWARLRTSDLTAALSVLAT